MRRYIYIGCVVFLLSLGLFSSVGLQNLDVNVYLLLLIIILFLVFLRGAPSKNPKFYHAAQCIVLANITAYISFKLYFGGPYTLLFAKHISFTMPLLILVILFIGSLFVLPLIRPLVDFNKLMYELIRNHFSKNSDRKSNSVALFYEHAKDKEHLRNLMQNFDIVGVSGAWGSGKSFVVGSFCNDSHDDYYIININVLAYKFGEADKVLVEKLDDIFSENHIISASSAEMKELMGHSFLNTISYALMKSLGIGNTSSSMYEALKEDINKLPKPVLVVFEDLERVKDADYVRLLLAMAGQLASHNFKVIFEYDINGLKELKISSAYREKFLPVEMRITKVSYQSMVKQYWEELKMDDVKVKYLKDGTSSILSLNGALLEIESTIFSYPCFEYNREVSGDQNYYERFFVPFMTARNIRRFLIVVKSFFTSHKDTEFTPIEFHTVIAFYFMKYVRPNWYERMTANFLLEDMLLFEINGKMVNFREIAQNYKDYSSSSENSASIVKAQCIMSMFQYNYGDDKKNLGEEETQAEINHMIWYLLEGGQKPFTRLRETLNCFKKIVQNDNKQEQNDIKDKSVNGTDKFDKFEEWLNDPRYLNNGYPELMNQRMIDISYALYVYNENEHLWEIFLAFYQGTVYSHLIGDMMYQVLYFAVKANHPHTFIKIKIFDIFIGGTCKVPLPVVNPLYLQFLGESLSIIVKDYAYFDFFKSTPETKESVNKLINQIKRTTDYKTLKQPLEDLRASLVKASDTSQIADKPVKMEKTVQFMEKTVQFIDKNLELIDQFLNGN